MYLSQCTSTADQFREFVVKFQRGKGTRQMFAGALESQVYSTGKGTDGVLGNGKEEHSLNDEGENKWIHVETLDEKKVGHFGFARDTRAVNARMG